MNITVRLNLVKIYKLDNFFLNEQAVTTVKDERKRGKLTPVVFFFIFQTAQERIAAERTPPLRPQRHLMLLQRRWNPGGPRRTTCTG